MSPFSVIFLPEMASGPGHFMNDFLFTNPIRWKFHFAVIYFLVTISRGRCVGSLYQILDEKNIIFIELWFWWHDDVIKWKHFPRNWPFVPGNYRSPVNSPHKGQWRGALIFSVILPLNKRLSKQSQGGWFETPLCSLWRHCNGTTH